MSAPKLTTYTFRVFGGDPDDPEEHIAKSVGRDIQRAESLFAENGWGQTSSRPMTSAAVVSYFSLTRTGLFEGTWDEFEDWYLSIEPVDPVNSFPTEPGPEPG